MFWIYLVSVAVCAAYALLWVRLRRAKKLLGNLPSWPQLPLIGNMLDMYGDGTLLFKRLTEMSQICEEKMQPFVLWLGPCPVIFTHEPDDVRTISNTLIEKPYFYSFGKLWLGNGLVTAPAPIWKVNIKKLSGTFTASVVDSYQSVFNAQARKLVNQLRMKHGGAPFDIMHHLAYTTLETICQTALGVTSISDSIVMEDYYTAFSRCFELFIARGLNLAMHPDCLFNLTLAKKELVKCVEVVHNVSDTVLKKRKLERQKIKENGSGDQAAIDTKIRSFLDILLEISEVDSLFTEQQIKWEVDTIILAGQETVATTLFYMLLMLGCRPRVQDKLHKEMKSIFGDSQRPVEKDDLAKMEYAEAVINETLRLFPPVPAVLRYADKEVQLKSCVVPIGTACVINAWGAGRSQRMWGPDASEYCPERWLKSKPPGAAFLAFSYGRRSCIGKKYAIAIVKTILAYCVRELEFVSEADNLEFKLDVALRAISGHMIQVKLRN